LAGNDELQPSAYAVSNVFARRTTRLPGWGLHALQGNLQSHWSLSVNGNWRMTFTFEGTDAVLVDYQDYH